MCETWVLRTASGIGPPFLPQVASSILAGDSQHWCRAWPRQPPSLTPADWGHEPHGSLHEAVGSRSLVAAMAAPDHRPRVGQVRGVEGILAMSWSHGPEAGIKGEGTRVGTA